MLVDWVPHSLAQLMCSDSANRMRMYSCAADMRCDVMQPYTLGPAPPAVHKRSLNAVRKA